MTFSKQFQDILKVANESTIYTDIKKAFEEQVIDRKSYEAIMINFHQVVLNSALNIAKDMMNSLQTVTIGEGDDAKEYTLQQVQILEALEKVNTEKERTKLLELQTVGFYDNRVIVLAETMRGVVGEIQSSGNDTPQQLWDAWLSSLSALATIASEHPNIDGVIAVPATAPTSD